MSKNYTAIKKLMFTQPAVLHGLLQARAGRGAGRGGGEPARGEGGRARACISPPRPTPARRRRAPRPAQKLADGVVDYIEYQHRNGAQVLQVFDSWAAQLSPQDFDVFAGPYLQYIFREAKRRCPDLPLILYISNSGGLLERMAAVNPDIISLCHTVGFEDAVKRAGAQFAYQGNMDSGVLFADKDAIERRVIETVRTAQQLGVRHILNLGHGVMQGTAEENVAHFFHVAKTVHERL
eukprot:scaffold13.g176.t1